MSYYDRRRELDMRTADRLRYTHWRWLKYGLSWLETVEHDGLRGGIRRERWFLTGRARKRWARRHLVPRNLATWIGKPW